MPSRNYSQLLLLLGPKHPKMQKLTLVLLMALVALATAGPHRFQRLTPVHPVPQCGVTEIAACAGEIGGKEIHTILLAVWSKKAFRSTEVELKDISCHLKRDFNAIRLSKKRNFY